MRIIDILNKKANCELENNFKFVYRDRVFYYNKERDEISTKSRKYFRKLV